MRRPWISQPLLASLLLIPQPGTAGKLPQPSEAAFATAEKLRAREMGVDSAGNLWAWNHKLATVQLLSPFGSTLAHVSVPQALRVDADEQWGVAAVLMDGWELGWIPWNGGAGKTIRLPSMAFDVAWIGPALVAVSPQVSGNRVEIWDLEKGSLVRAFGKEAALPRVFGATRMRTIRLVFDGQRQQLYTFDSYLGDLLVLSLLCFLTLQIGEAPICDAVQGQSPAKTLEAATPADASSRHVLLWTGDQAQKRWVEVTPFAPDVKDKLLQFPEGSASVPLEGLPPGPAFLCAGAEGRPTRCEKVFLEAGKPLSVTTPPTGVRVTGRLLIGRKPAPGARIGVVPHPLPMQARLRMAGPGAAGPLCRRP